MSKCLIVIMVCFLLILKTPIVYTDKYFFRAGGREHRAARAVALRVLRRHVVVDLRVGRPQRREHLFCFLKKLSGVRKLATFYRAKKRPPMGHFYLAKNDPRQLRG